MDGTFILLTSLGIPIYTVEIDIDAHVWVFRKVILANGEKNDVDIINLFCFMLRYVILEWGEIFV
jgi:hypothetical protein